jgi:GNAT superfamily N-acetyltransferase
VSALRVLPATYERWADLVDLFERKGPRGGHRNTPGYGCWCMYWRDRALAHGTPKKRALEALVRAGREPGLLAYDAKAAVGWISVAPREEYEALLGSPQYRPRDQDRGVWSIVCFVVDRPRQGEGIAGVLLDGAVKHAGRRSAIALEAYPHRSKKDNYMGHLDLFLDRGFQVVRETSTRAVVRRTLQVVGRPQRDLDASAVPR